ncbi:type II toxin-antitoxin system RelE/ParE family toxin [Anatilimnocola floriformis]|uniref:type II toxin-antitoxin system RelE/ParE family toxin n=1 Tax=Anatilimnocola floriformis TaxID=2948575 RepID=UPI0020C3DE19|nr:type II toxin-antitoxin system RelE/ParE family toxin [Anatilimnocola floriformis]
MKYTIAVLAAAHADVEQIIDWLEERSKAGVIHWIESYEAALDVLTQEPERHALAPEASVLQRPVRQLLFRTRRGRRYRLIYLVDGMEVQILRVRTPSERPLDSSDI